MRGAILGAALLLVTSCAVIGRQRAEIVPDDLQFHNLQVLPVNITRDELIDTMRGFTQALGVRCEHCHMRTAEGSEEFDFPSDAKEEKRIARTMIRMTRTINDDFVGKVRRHDGRVTCGTCHRGRAVPER
ncbi:MAG TPA: c-type cytochrome [Thermoanaerobaculia bacterium]|nr:c-type cytochrome [Thermoanaerobaculia bacterium]